jgi:hypothetical protein
LILAESEHRARELARRELVDTRQALSIELCEGGRVLWAETVEPTQDRPACAARQVRRRQLVVRARRGWRLRGAT